ncbi:MAG: hypothetical protein ACLP7O_02420, partial [Terracidiphilus sp.]
MSELTAIATDQAAAISFAEYNELPGSIETMTFHAAVAAGRIRKIVLLTFAKACYDNPCRKRGLTT